MPCDIYAIKRFVKNNPNLYTISLVCHGPTSSKIHKIFCDEVTKQLNDSLTSFSVRYKNNGNWKPYYIHATSAQGSQYLQQFNNTDYNLAFLYFKRPSCTDCVFKNDRFAADLLIGDYHAASEGSKYWNAHGVSSIIPLTERGFELLKSVDNSFMYSEVPLKTAISQKAIHSSVIKPTDRKEFVDMLNNFGLHDACNISSIKNDVYHSKKMIKRNRSLVRKIYRKVLG